MWNKGPGCAILVSLPIFTTSSYTTHSIQVHLPKPAGFICSTELTWNHEHWLFCLKGAEKAIGIQAVRISGCDMLTQGTLRRAPQSTPVVASWLWGFKHNMWISLSQLLLPQERMSTDRSLANSSHYCFSVTASWKPSSLWDMAKGHRWKKN